MYFYYYFVLHFRQCDAVFKTFYFFFFLIIVSDINNEVNCVFAVSSPVQNVTMEQ